MDSKAATRSSASVSVFGGSSTIGSQPTGGEPGGEIKKFFSIPGTLKWRLSSSFPVIGVGGREKTRRRNLKSMSNAIARK